MSDIQLLRECLNSQSEAEAGGVKFVYMDDNTVYRFENNRMKKVSKALINKAKSADNATKTKRGRRSTKQIMENDDMEEEQEQEQEEMIKPIKQVRRAKQIKPIITEEEEQEEMIKPTKQVRRPKQPKTDINAPNIDLNEYYHTKNKMEFMTQEMERMNKKITKLKQYKSMFNRLNGGEYDIQDTQQMTQPKQTIPDNAKIINDNLFMY